MSNIKEKQKDILIDVTETFDYSGQSDEYINAYKKWRNNPDNPFAYNYIKKKNEVTFCESKGFVKIIPEEKEQKVFYSVYIFKNIYSCS